MRPFRRRLAAVLLAAAVPAVGAASRAADTYPVKIDRPMTVGQSFAVTAKADVTQSVTGKDGGHTWSDANTFATDLVGTMTVEAVAAKTGTPTKVTVALNHLVKDGDDVLPPGTVVTVDRTGPADAYTAGGKPLDKAAVTYLSILLDVDKPDRTITDDEMAGTSRPQPVGGTWAGRPEQLALILSGLGLPLKGADLTVDGKLVEAKSVNGTPAVVVTTTFAGATKEPKTSADGAGSADATLHGTNTYTLPADPALPVAVVEQHTTIDLKTAGRSSTGGRVTVQRTAEQTIRRTLAVKSDPSAATRPAR